MDFPPPRPVAICTLGSNDLRQALSEHPDFQGCIVAGLTTENIGIEQLIQFCVGSPSLRTIILCGDDPQQAIGHLPGQSILALSANGLDEQRRIIGAQGKRPVIQNLTPEAIQRFREQVTLIDTIGQTDATLIAQQAIALLAESPEPLPVFTASIETPVPHYQVTDRFPMQCDTAGYVVITTDTTKRTITAEHFENNGTRTLKVTGDNLGSVFQELSKHPVMTQLDHAAYLGRELYRAQQSLESGEYFIQDDVPPEYSFHQPCE